MKITQITYEQLVNTGNYENRKLAVTAHVDEGEDPAVVYEQLRDFTQKQLRKR